MINFKVLFHFIKKIITNWIIYLGFLPKVYDYIGAYFKWDYTLPTWAIISFTVLVIVYAVYKAYEEEYISREILEKKLAGPTKYEIKVFLIPIDFKEENLIVHLKSLKQKAEDKLQSLPKPIVISQYDKHAYAPEQAMSSFSKKDKSSQEYNEELRQYESELRSIVNNTDKYEESLISSIESFEKKFFFVKFLLINTGTTSDSNIDVTIECKDNCKVYLKEDVLKNEMDLFKWVPSIPKEPSQPRIISYDAFASQRLDINPSFNFNDFNIESPLDFRKMLTIEDHKCSVTIRDLHVGDEIDIFDKELILMKEDDIVDFIITIKSKESTKVLTPIAGIEEIDTKRSLYGSEEKAT